MKLPARIWHVLVNRMVLGTEDEQFTILREEGLEVEEVVVAECD